jgi:hypothetical protein
VNADETKLMTPMTDWEFPWVIVDDEGIHCTRCGERGVVEYWMTFLDRHSKCRDENS